MQLSRPVYRAALLHLSFNPIFARAAISSTSSLNTTPYSSQAPNANTRLHSVLFPQCASPFKTIDQTRQAHTMSSSDPTKEKQDSTESQPQDEASTKPTEQLYLPDRETADKSHQLDLSAEGGSTVTLDHLGPMVVNKDGSLSRISNWENMAEIERKNTLRVIGKRNKQRLEAVKAARAAEEQK